MITELLYSIQAGLEAGKIAEGLYNGEHWEDVDRALDMYDAINWDGDWETEVRDVLQCLESVNNDDRLFVKIKAWFLRALCYTNLGEFVKARQYISRVLNAPVDSLTLNKEDIADSKKRCRDLLNVIREEESRQQELIEDSSEQSQQTLPSSKISESEQIFGQYWEFVNSGKTKEALQFAYENKDRRGCEELYLRLGESLYPDYEQAINYFNEGINRCQEINDSDLLAKFIYGRAQCALQLSDYVLARNDAWYVHNVANPSLLNSDNVSIRDHALELYQISEELLIEHFSEIPKNELIFLVDELPVVYPEYILLLRIGKLPNISFIQCTPTVNHIYCSLNSGEYCSVDNYRTLCLIYAINEFMSFATSIGAAEITIKPIDNNNSDCRKLFKKTWSMLGLRIDSVKNEFHMKYNVSGPIQLHPYPDWYYRLNWREYFIDRITNNFLEDEQVYTLSSFRFLDDDEYQSVHRDFSLLGFSGYEGLYYTSPGEEEVGLVISVKYYSSELLEKNGEMSPYLSPFGFQVEDMFPTERGVVVTGRVHSGKINQNDKVILVNKSGIVKEDVIIGLERNREFVTDAIYGDSIGMLLKYASESWVEIGDFIYKKKNKERRTNNQSDNISTTTQRPSFHKETNVDNKCSEEEQDYIEMYKEYVADGEISERDRKMLDKFRSRCGISEERARELEASCNKPQLTEDEQEYLEMYKEYAADGEISERDRKMLNKMRDRMGISEERAKEIEKL